MPKPSKTRIDAPKRLQKMLHAVGFHGHITISRRNKADVDPGSDVPGVDAEFSEDDIAMLKGLLAQYDKGPQKGEPMKP